MNPRTTMKLLSAITGVLLVAGGIVLIVTGNEGEHSSALLMAGIGLVTGGVGTALFPRVGEPCAKAVKRAGPATLLLALAVGSTTLTACGATWLDTHAPIAKAAQSVQIASEPIIRELRIDAIQKAIRQAQAQGATLAETQAARARTERDWQCVVEAHRLYGTLVSAYIEALWLAERTGREPDGADGDGQLEASDFVPYIHRAADAYRAIAACVDTLEASQLPVPAFLDLIPAAWETRHG